MCNDWQSSSDVNKCLNVAKDIDAQVGFGDRHPLTTGREFDLNASIEAASRQCESIRQGWGGFGKKPSDNVSQ
jgi:hypothetical protein